MGKWNQEDRVYCVLKDVHNVGERIAENTAMLMTHFDDVERILECIEVYNELSQRLLCMADGMMELANLSERYRARKREPFLLGHFFISITGQAWPEAEKKNQCFSSYNGGVVHEHVIGDQQMLMKACSRIIRNAVKYTGEGGNIIVCLTELPWEDGHAHYQLQVKDNGRGMAPEEIDKVLSLYPEGGFGLPAADRILGKMGGGIRLESVQGMGTTVTADFFLELQNPFPSWEGEIPGRKVLVFEKSQEEKEEVRRLLVQLGAECIAVCGRDDLERCLNKEGSAYDLVCVGERAVPEDLPGFLKYIRWKTGNRTCIILVSSYNKEISAESMWSGADGYIQRPLFCAGLQALFRTIDVIR